MKIRRVSSSIEHFELTRPYTIAFRTVDSVRTGSSASKPTTARSDSAARRRSGS